MSQQDPRELKQALDAVAECGSISAAARSLNIPRTTVRDRYYAALSLQARPAPLEDYPSRRVVGIDNGVVLVFSDAHYYPGEASTAHRALLRAIHELRPRGIVNNGDAFDGASISRHPRIGWEMRPTVKQELAACSERLGEVAEEAKGYAWLHWNIGNHDQRFDSFLSAQASQMEGLEGVTLRERFPEWGMSWRLDINPGADSHTIIKHRWRGGIHAATNNPLHAGVSMVTGHLHKLDVRRITDARGTRYGVDTGCVADVLGDQFSAYTEDGITGWRSGFAVLTYRDGRLLTPEVVQVVAPGVVEFRGREYRV